MTETPPNLSLPYPSDQNPIWERVHLLQKVRWWLHVGLKRWPILFLGVLLGLGYGGFKAYTTPDFFIASSRLGMMPKVETGKPQVAEDAETYYETQVGYMYSPSVMTKVYERLNQQKPPDGPKPTILKTVASRLPSTTSFELTVTSSNFKYAQDFSRYWAEEFINYKNDLAAKAVNRGAKDLVEEERKNVGRLEAIDESIRKFQELNNVVSAKDMGDGAQTRYDKTYDDLLNVQKERKLYEVMNAETLADMLSGRGRPGPAIAPGKEGAGSGKSARAEAESISLMDQINSLTYSELRSRLKAKTNEWVNRLETLQPAHPYLVSLSNEVQQIQEQIRGELEKIERGRLAYVEELNKREKGYVALLEECRKEVNKYKGIQQEYNDLKEQRDRILSNLAEVRKRINEISQTTTTEVRIEITAAGEGSAGPAGPKRAKIVVNGLLGGWLAALALIYGLVKIDDRLHLAEDIEKSLDLPVLGQIPQMSAKEMPEGRIFIPRLNVSSMFSESFRGVRSALMFSKVLKDKPVLVVTSSLPGEGKTTMSVNFAATLAMAGYRVLIIDADMRRGSTHTYVQHTVGPGLAEILDGSCHWLEAMQSTDLPTLFMIHAGRPPAHPGELLLGPMTEQLITETRQEFDYVVFDSPPLASIDDTFALVRLVDGVLFVVKSGQTSMRFATNSLAALRQRGAHIYGLLVNGITSAHPYYAYQKYYHSYYQSPVSADEGSGAVGKSPRQRRKRTAHLASIEVAARKSMGQPISAPLVRAEAQAKIDAFKVRRASLKKGLIQGPGLAPQELISSSFVQANFKDQTPVS